MIINTSIPYDYFDVVYLITDPDQRPYQVIGIKITADGGLQVELQSGTLNYFAYVGEIATQKQYAT